MRLIKWGAMLLLLSLLVACNVDQDIPVDDPETSNDTPTNEDESEPSEDGSQEGEIEMTIDQFAMPEAGETVAEMYVKDFGVIKLKLFPEVAPKAVENFLTLAKDGYYEGVTFHRVMDDFMIQGGDPTGTGAGGQSIWGQSFEDEFSLELFPYRGALCMANAGPNTNGSQFFVVQLEEAVDTYVEQMENAQWPEDIINNYKEKGGTPWLFHQHTVFGQVYEGMDVVDAIAAVEVDSSSSKPLEDVVIERIEVKEYAE